MPYVAGPHTCKQNRALRADERRDWQRPLDDKYRSDEGNSSMTTTERHD